MPNIPYSQESVLWAHTENLSMSFLPPIQYHCCAFKTRASGPVEVTEWTLLGSERWINDFVYEILNKAYGKRNACVLSKALSFLVVNVA